MSEVLSDVVIIGGGAAGCVLADRLSANADQRVTLIEAGRVDANPLHSFAMLTGYFYRRPQDNWFFHTEPQPQLVNRTIFWPRGKRLGGSSIFNGMVYARGNAGDFDLWASLGNEGWSYEDVLPYFKRNERHEGGETELHGGSGMLRVGRSGVSNPLFAAFIEAGKQAGYREVADLNGHDFEGVGYYDFHMEGGRRSNSARVLLEHASSRKNLTLIGNSVVTRVLLEGRRAVGVELFSEGQRRIIRAAREVVLASGAIGSPHLLMLSGIGDSEQLKAAGITPVHHLPGVGRDLIDHLDVSVKVSARKPISLHRELRIDRIVANVARAMLTGKGPVTESAIAAGGYFRSSPELEYPDLQAFFMPIYGTDAAVWVPFTTRAREVREKHGFSLRIGPVRPQSRGTLTLKSPDPLVAPKIDPAYLTAAADMQATIAGLRIARNILQQPAFSRYRDREIAPGPGITTDSDLERYVRENANTVYHPAGGARMGKDPLAVVNARLSVHGIQGLRVADASVMPTITSGNTNAPTMMIAEKAADMIEQDLKRGTVRAG